MISAYGVTTVMRVYLDREEAVELRDEIRTLTLNGGTQLEQLYKALDPALNNTIPSYAGGV